MKAGRPNNRGKTSKTPRRPFDKERLDRELEVCGEYGLKNKRELWRVELILSKIRKAARLLLTLEEKDPKRIFEGEALLGRLERLGLLKDEKRALDYVLGLSVEDFLNTRLQTKCQEFGHAKSIHHARCLVRHGHVTVNNRRVNIPSFMVHVKSGQCIDFNVNSPMYANGGIPGRHKKRSLKNGSGGD